MDVDSVEVLELRRKSPSFPWKMALNLIGLALYYSVSHCSYLCPVDFIQLFLVAPKVLVEAGKPQLQQALVPFANLRWNGPTCGDDIAASKEGEDKAEARDLPRGILSKWEIKQSVRVVQLEEVPDVEEGQQETQSWKVNQKLSTFTNCNSK